MNLVIETERLILRPFELSDAEAYFEMDKNPEVHKYLWNKPVTTIEEVYEYINMVRQQYLDNNIGRFSTILKETGELIGWTGIKYVTGHVENGNTNFYDYGYRLNEKFWKTFQKIILNLFHLKIRSGMKTEKLFSIRMVLE